MFWAKGLLQSLFCAALQSNYKMLLFGQKQTIENPMREYMRTNVKTWAESAAHISEPVSMQ